VLALRNHNEILLCSRSVLEGDDARLGFHIHDLVSKSNDSTRLFSLGSETSVHVDAVVEKPLVSVQLLHVGEVQGRSHGLEGVALGSSDLDVLDTSRLDRIESPVFQDSSSIWWD
jgi:hypothetical protein